MEFPFKSKLDRHLKSESHTFFAKRIEESLFDRMDDDTNHDEVKVATPSRHVTISSHSSVNG